MDMQLSQVAEKMVKIDFLFNCFTGILRNMYMENSSLTNRMNAGKEFISFFFQFLFSQHIKYEVYIVIRT